MFFLFFFLLLAFIQSVCILFGFNWFSFGEREKIATSPAPPGVAQRLNMAIKSGDGKQLHLEKPLHYDSKVLHTHPYGGKSLKCDGNTFFFGHRHVSGRDVLGGGVT